MSDEDHPLNNDVVLRLIFEYCTSTIDCVRTHRFVNKAWKQASEPQWKSFTVPVTIFQDGNLQQQENTEGETPPIPLSQFIRQQNDPKRRKNWNLELRDWTILDGHFTVAAENDNADLNQCFWSVHAKDAVVLTLNGCTIPWSDSLFESRFLSDLPNLERLSLVDCKIARCDWTDWTARESCVRADEDIHMGLDVLNINVQNNVFNYEELENINFDIMQPLQPTPNTRLTFLCVQNLECISLTDEIVWSALPRKFPNVKEFSVRYQARSIDELFRTLGTVCYVENLKKLDIMNAECTASESCRRAVFSWPWPLLSLDKLTLDCGFRTNRQNILRILETQAETLETLHLYRAPFADPYANFPCSIELFNLTELRLWGNVSSNLDFLKLVPNLKVLSWNTSCYDDAYHGSRIHRYLRSVDLSPKLNRNIVENTEGLDEEFKLDSLNTLEIDLGPVSLECFRKLGAWMPNVQNLKGTVVGEQQFVLIGVQWPNIKKLELLHGSAFSPNRTLEALLPENLSGKLESFIWKRCPCPWKAEDSRPVQVAGRAFSMRARGRIGITWRRFIRLDQGAGQIVCLQRLFDGAMTNGAAAVRAFLNAVANRSGIRRIP